MPETQRDNMITHYGLFWSETSVFWGRQKNPGQLWGRTTPESPAAARKAQEGRAQRK